MTMLDYCTRPISDKMKCKISAPGRPPFQNTVKFYGWGPYMLLAESFFALLIVNISAAMLCSAFLQ